MKTSGVQVSTKAMKMTLSTCKFLYLQSSSKYVSCKYGGIPTQRFKKVLMGSKKEWSKALSLRQSTTVGISINDKNVCPFHITLLILPGKGENISAT
jgi:hypothetical protein